jgi:hypothetical protein
MTSPQPIPETVSLYNRMIHLPYREQNEINRIAWRLRQQYQKNPKDPQTIAALLYAVTGIGEVQEAKELAERGWGLRHLMDSPALESYLLSLARIGLYNKVLTIFNELQFEKIPRTSNIFSLAATSCLAAGNLRLPPSLERLRESKTNHDVEILSSHDYLWSFVNRIRTLDLEDSFKSYMTTVNELVHGEQCDIDCYPYNFEGEVELVHVVYVVSERSKRRSMEENIDHALRHNKVFEYLETTPLVTTIVMDMRAHRTLQPLS